MESTEKRTVGHLWKTEIYSCKYGQTREENLLLVVRSFVPDWSRMRESYREIFYREGYVLVSVRSFYFWKSVGEN